MAAGDFTPYSTVSEYVSTFPGWVPEDDKERIASYTTYEQIYWSHPTTFKLTLRGSENKPIYLPSGRIIVDTMNRFLARKFNFTTEAALGATAGAEQQLADQFLRDFWRRERMRSKFAAAKFYGIMRGDWLFHIVADPDKPKGQQISIQTIDPAMWFPVYDDEDLENLIKVHIAEQYTDAAGKQWIRRQTYAKDQDTGIIFHSIGLFDADKWTGDGKAGVELVPEVPLDSRITAFPVYHISNFEQPSNPFGSSEMRGLERLMTALNQAVSDEDLSLALSGLGVYFTKGGGPTDEKGNDLPWQIAPGSVLENVDDFERVKGIDSVQPYTDHMETVWSFMKMAGNTPDIAIGKVDVQVAESGIALALQMSPILSRAEDKLEIISDVMDQFLYDLRVWFAVYDGINMDNTRFHPTFADPLPQNRKAETDLVGTLVTSKIMSTQTARTHLAKYGFEFADNEQELVDGETASTAAATDPLGARLGSETEDAPTAGDDPSAA